MKMNDIKEIARQRGINPAKMKKIDLIRAIQQDEGNPDCCSTGIKEECGQADCLWRDRRSEVRRQIGARESLAARSLSPPFASWSRC